MKKDQRQAGASFEEIREAVEDVLLDDDALNLTAEDAKRLTVKVVRRLEARSVRIRAQRRPLSQWPVL